MSPQSGLMAPVSVPCPSLNSIVAAVAVESTEPAAVCQPPRGTPNAWAAKLRSECSVTAAQWPWPPTCQVPVILQLLLPPAPVIAARPTRGQSTLANARFAVERDSGIVLRVGGQQSSGTQGGNVSEVGPCVGCNRYRLPEMPPNPPDARESASTHDP